MPGAYLALQQARQSLEAAVTALEADDVEAANTALDLNTKQLREAINRAFPVGAASLPTVGVTLPEGVDQSLLFEYFDLGTKPDRTPEEEAVVQRLFEALKPYFP